MLTGGRGGRDKTSCKSADEDLTRAPNILPSPYPLSVVKLLLYPLENHLNSDPGRCLKI